MHIAPEHPPAGARKSPIVCYVTDRISLASVDARAPVPGLLANLRRAVEAGVDWVQIRERSLPARELLALAREAVRISAPNARVIVNDRLDIAIAAGAAGVHLGGESLPACEVVSWRRGGNTRAGFLVGVSCHSLADAREAEAAGANYVVFGPVFDTPAKARFGPPQGLGKLAEVCRGLALPVIAIGGVNEGNAVECVRAGAAGIAAIRMFQEARGPEELKRSIERLHRLE